MKTNQTYLDMVNPHPRIVGTSNGQPNYIDPKRVIYDHELMLFGSGGSFILNFEDGRHYEFGSNTFVIIPPGQWHVCRGIICEHVDRSWIHFDWSFDNRPVADLDMTYAPAEPLPHLYHHAPDWMPSELMHGTIDNPESAFSLHRRISERFNFSTGSRQKSSRALLLEVLLQLLGDESESVSARPMDRVVSPFNPFSIRDALDAYAQQSFNDCPPMKHYLQDRGQSYDHQARLFKKSFGISPLQYVNSLRIEHACNLLIDTSMKVGEIAEHLGYDDLVYFGRLFKKVVGKSPQSFRLASNTQIACLDI